MDNLTHGLLGLSIAALRRRPPEDAERGPSQAQMATMVACLLAAELPDLDALLPAGNEVLHALHAHRGLSHALVMAPVWAGLATGISKRLFRGQRAGPIFAYALLSVLAAHLAADAWTGWGTRLLLPFSEARVTWDWMVVVDPVFTLPLLAGAVAAVLWRRHWRRAVLLGFGVASLYLGTRIGVRAALEARVRDRYPAAERVSVFPGWFGISRWRFVVTSTQHFVAGEISLTGEPVAQATVPRRAPGAALAQDETVRAALAWARFPVLEETRTAEGGRRVRVGDLRYHLGGEPTLRFVVTLSPQGAVTEARLERGGTASELLRRWRAVR